jgi:hypothetical protein
MGLTINLVPKYMKDSSRLWKEKIGDVREFSRTYAVKKGTMVEKLDLPVIDEATLVKIFYKSSPGLSSKVKILDSKENVIFDSAKGYQISTTSAIINPEIDSNGEVITQKGFIVFEYTVNNTEAEELKLKDIKPCWSNQVIVTMVPYSEFVQNSKCEVVKSNDIVSTLQKQSSQFYDIYEFPLGLEPISIDEKVIIENQKVKIKLKPDITSINDKAVGNLLISIYYDLQFVTLTSKLMKNDGTLQKFIKYGTTEAFENELGTETSLSKIANSITVKLDSSFFSTSSTSFLEAEFSLSSRFLTMFDSSSNTDLCFAVNLLVEYIPPKPFASLSDSESGSSLQLAYVKPALLNKISIQKFNNITVELGFSQSLLAMYPEIDMDSSLSGTMLAQM